MGQLKRGIACLGVLLAVIQIASAESYTNSEEALHATAHAGGSYVLTHATQAACSLATAHRHKQLCLLGGVLIAAGAGVVKEVVVDKGESNKRHFMGYAADATGISAAVTFINFSW